MVTIKRLLNGTKKQLTKGMQRLNINNLGVCYLNGAGVIRSYSGAVYWFKQAAKNGDQDAQFILQDWGETW